MHVENSLLRRNNGRSQGYKTKHLKKYRTVFNKSGYNLHNIIINKCTIFYNLSINCSCSSNYFRFLRNF